MQQAQQNCLMILAFLALGTVLLPRFAVAAGAPVVDPLLAETTGPCEPGLDGPDYVAWTDVDGNPVTSADLPQAKVAVPDSVLVPLAGPSRRSRNARPQAYAELSQKSLESILNRQPACPSARKGR